MAYILVGKGEIQRQAETCGFKSTLLMTLIHLMQNIVKRLSSLSET